MGGLGTGDLQPAGVNNDLVSATSEDKIHGWNLEMPRRGQSVPDWHRNFVVGDYRLEI